MVRISQDWTSKQEAGDQRSPLPPFVKPSKFDKQIPFRDDHLVPDFLYTEKFFSIATFQ